VSETGDSQPAAAAGAAQEDDLVSATIPAEPRGAGGERARLRARLERSAREIVALRQALGCARAMATMGALVAGVAHEVRNPLFSISASLDALERQFGISTAAAPYAAALRSSVQRLNDLMVELLEYGRPHGNPLLPGPLREVIAQAIESCQAQARASRVSVSNTVSHGLPPVPMDRGRLTLVFRNLVENALHHSVPGGSVTVEAARLPEACGPLLDCRVRDCGPGFRDEDLPRVFEPFYTRRRGGTGLGLAIAQRIVHQHGGSIRAFNHRHGGAVVGVRLPLHQAADGARDADAARAT